MDNKEIGEEHMRLKWGNDWHVEMGSCTRRMGRRGVTWSWTHEKIHDPRGDSGSPIRPRVIGGEHRGAWANTVGVHDSLHDLTNHVTSSSSSLIWFPLCFFLLSFFFSCLEPWRKRTRKRGRNSKAKRNEPTRRGPDTSDPPSGPHPRPSNSVIDREPRRPRFVQRADDTSPHCTPPPPGPPLPISFVSSTFILMPIYIHSINLDWKIIIWTSIILLNTVSIDMNFCIQNFL